MPKTATADRRPARRTPAAPAARRRAAAPAAAAAPPLVDTAVEALVAWAIEEGMRAGDLDELVLDAHLEVARLDHAPEHIKVSGQRDFVCEAQEEVAYDAALAVNMAGFTRQFRFLVERLPEVRPTPPEAKRPVADPITLVRSWVERYRAG